MTGLRLVPQNRRFRGGRCQLDAGQSRCSAHSAVLAARPPTRATARAARQRSAQNRHLGSARAPGFPPRRPSCRSILPRCCQIPDHNPRGRPEPATLRGTAAARPASVPDGADLARAAVSADTTAAAANPPAVQDGRRRGFAGAVAVQPVTAKDPAARRGRRPRSAPTPTRTAALALRPSPPIRSPASCDPPARKPRPRTTNGRRQTAGRIDDNSDSPNSGAQPLPAIEGTAGLVVCKRSPASAPPTGGGGRRGGLAATVVARAAARNPYL